MQQQGTHDQRATSLHATINRLRFLLYSIDAGGPKPAMPMRTRKDFQSSAFCSGIIEMKSYGEQLFQHTYRWLHVSDARLKRPAGEMRDLLFVPYRNSEILMPRNLPIRLWCFVKKDSPNNLCLRAGDWLDYFSHTPGTSQLSNEGRHIKKIPDPKKTLTALFGGVTARYLSQLIDKAGYGC